MKTILGIVAAVWCFASPTLACAQSAPNASPGSAASPGPQASPAPTEAPAIHPFGRYAGEFAGNASGGFASGTGYASEVQFGSDFNFAKITGGNAGIAHVVLTERFGSSLSKDTLGNIGSVEEIYGDGSTFRLTEADYEQTFANEHVNLKLGRVVMQNDFAAASTYWGSNLWCFYQSNAICGTPVAAPNNSGYGYYPSSEWGARVKLAPSKSFFAEAGAYQVDPAYARSNGGFNEGFAGTTGTMFPFETGVTLHDGAGRERANVRIGAYYDTSNVTTAVADIANYVPASYAPTLGLPTTTYRGRSGGWLLLDALLAGGSDPKGTGTAAFASYEYGDPQTALISNFVDGGVVRRGTFRGRDTDTFALGFDWIQVNPRIRAFETALAQRGIVTPLNDDEITIEANYGVQVAKSIVLRPGLQYVVHPAGQSGITTVPGGIVGSRSALVYDLGTYLSF